LDLCSVKRAFRTSCPKPESIVEEAADQLWQLRPRQNEDGRNTYFGIVESAPVNPRPDRAGDAGALASEKGGVHRAELVPAIWPSKQAARHRTLACFPVAACDRPWTYAASSPASHELTRSRPLSDKRKRSAVVGGAAGTPSLP
jgi:hypothetical protein